MNLQTDMKNSLPEVHQLLIERFKAIEFFDRFSSFRANLEKRCQNDCKLIALLYVRATKQKLYSLHLASQDNFVKYFFS